MTPSGPTVAQLKAQPESLWHFLGQLPGSFEAQIFYALILFGVVGMAGSYFVKWVKEEIEGNVICYLFIQHPRRTLLSFSTYIGLMLTALSTGVFMQNGEFVGWYVVLWISLTTGFGVDVTANKGTTKVFTPEERAEKRAEIAADKP